MIEPVLYFGYGSNLNLGDLARWCREKDVAPPRLRVVGPAWLPDHELVFHYRSKARSGGALDVRARRGAAVEGMIFETDERGARVLDRKEGAPSYYERTERVALTADGREVSVTTYVVTDAHRQDRHVPPTDEYVRVVREGLARHGLDDAALVAAAAGLDAPRPRAIFVYGTLLSGEPRHPIVARHRPLRTSDSSIAGRLVHLGEYPGWVAGDGGRVRGELVELEDTAAVLRELDDVEGFLGYGVEGSLYRRVIVEAHRASGDAALAWSYRWLGSADAPRIDSGDWRKR